ncbi:MAG: type II secretion system ATPase GspE [Porticoccaceae bacterium]|jgi:general secretion pathway protein E|nr:type II secretion system ATPase GspE [Porticoccaceae bacterium]MBT4213348.1 type II secretion system ATPase GspE [Porticoccaceae bacterium]MBT5070862.1 type II secretion system ATPase GspE [Porticoccaceae bacterium]MBT6780161.1 type II secretion system ATPase GspE [Porticoccaceae bacterium]MBT7946971.1 type II secretion system ATPase GspE [Porticoccaceae bacterium]
MAQPNAKLLPFEFARSNGLLVRESEGDLVLSPDASQWAITEVSRINNGFSSISRVDSKVFDKMLSEIYSGRKNSSESVMEDIKDFVDMESAAADLEDTGDLLDSEDDAPIIRLLNAILAESLKENASDIHIEPYEKESLVRFRLDGVLSTVLSPSAQITPLLISRIKVMSKLDIAEKRLPQDGRMSVKLGGRSIDLRISTMPSSHGERVVMRLLDKDAGKLQVDDLGMPSATSAQLDDLIRRPHGIILVTGPTGSGKTTTLYAALQQMDRQGRNIMTVEDPVEYDLPGISQTQINLRAGMTFARGLKAILRQDPDVILIGEIRDGETAEIATQSSLTGHLVLSTLHTNTAAGAITRLQDLGVDSFLLASTIRGILSQRLLRKLCHHCRQPVEPNEFNRDLLKLEVGHKIYEAAGCEKCNSTGYAGRQALFELVSVDAQLQTLIHENAGEIELESKIREHVPSIREAGFSLVRDGMTTIEEVLRVTSV